MTNTALGARGATYVQSDTTEDLPGDTVTRGATHTLHRTVDSGAPHSTRRRIRSDEKPLYSQIDQLGITDGTSTHEIAYFAPERNGLYVKKAPPKDADGQEKAGTHYTMELLPTPCPKVERVITFCEDASDQRVFFDITINGQTETTPAGEIQNGKAWERWAATGGAPRKLANLLACAVLAQVNCYGELFNIPTVQGETASGWRTAGDGTHYYITPTGQILTSHGMTPHAACLNVTVRPRAAYEYRPHDTSLAADDFTWLQTYWHSITTDSQLGIFLFGAVARMLANDLHMTPEGIVIEGETSTGKSALANLMRAATATVAEKTPFIGTGADRPGGLELAVTQLRSTVMVIDDVQGDGQNHEKQARIFDMLLRSYSQQEPVGRRASSTMRRTPDHVVSSPPVILAEYLAPGQLQSGLNRPVLLSLGTIADGAVQHATLWPDVRRGRSVMKQWGYSFLCWLAGAWNADPSLPDAIAATEETLTTAILAALPGETTSETRRMVRSYAGYLAGWYLLTTYATAHGWAITVTPRTLVEWAARKVQEQARRIARTATDLPDAMPFGAWVCATIRATLEGQHAHLVDRATGRTPTSDGLPVDHLGYRVQYFEQDTNGPEATSSQPQGPTLGEMDQDTLYIHSGTVFNILRTAARMEKRPFPTSEKEAWARLVEDGILTRNSQGEATHSIRFQEKKVRRLLIPVAFIWPDSVPDDPTSPPLDAGTVIDARTTPTCPIVYAPLPATPDPADSTTPDERRYLDILAGFRTWPEHQRWVRAYVIAGSPVIPMEVAPGKTKGNTIAPTAPLQGEPLVRQWMKYYTSADMAERDYAARLIKTLASLQPKGESTHAA